MPGSRSESLDVVYRRALQQARDAAAWYDRRRAAKRRWAMYLRVGAIVLASIAAVLPLLSQLFSDVAGGRPPPDRHRLGGPLPRRLRDRPMTGGNLATAGLRPDAPREEKDRLPPRDLTR